MTFALRRLAAFAAMLLLCACATGGPPPGPRPLTS